MDYLPIFFSLEGRPCLVVGGGKVGHRKATHLLRAGGRVTVAAPEVVPELAELAEAGEIVHLPEPFVPGMLAGQALVVSATEKREVNRQVADAAQAANLPVNVVDDPELSSFIFPAVVDRSPVLVAVSTGGRSPVLARLIKARLESLVPVAYGRLAELAGEFRDRVKARFAQLEGRRKFWEKHFQGEAASLFLAGEEARARALLDQDLAGDTSAAAGSVSMVSVHPDDPELLTLKALRRLQEADVLVVDPGVPGRTLDMARRDAERIVAGTGRGVVTCPLAEVPALLVRLAGEGRHVVRVCAGREAPAEEAAALAAAGVPCSVVPGGG